MQSEPQNPNSEAVRWINELGKHAVEAPEWKEAVDGLTVLGFAVVPKLIDSLAGADLSTRTGITRALHEIGPTVLYDVIDALVHDDSTVRREAAYHLACTASQRERLITNIVPVLIDGLADRESMVRVRTAQALCLLGERAQLAVPALIEALLDRESYVRQWSASALGAVGSGAIEAIPALTEALLDEDEFVRDEASRAIDAIQREPGT